MNRVKINRQQKKDLLFFSGLLLGVFLLVWKSKYGTGAYDEPFYLTMPHRIVNGDGMFSEEWNFGQLSAFLMLPVMKLYLLICKGTEGIILNFRYIYIVFQTVCTLALYMRLRKKELAWAAAWLFLLFTPYDIMAMSYNTMGLACMTLTGAILSATKENKAGAWIVSGVLFAAAVLCNPFLVVVYLLYTVVTAGFMLKRKKCEDNRTKEEERVQELIFGKKAWLYITLGAAGEAVLFVIAVLWHSTVNELLENIPLLMNDPEHTSRSIFMIVKVYLTEFWKVYGFFIPVWAVLLFMAFCFRKDREKRKVFFVLLCICSAVSMLTFIPTIQNSYNFIMVPIAVCGLGAYLMTEKREKQQFICFYVFGLLYSFMANYASNQGMHAISMAMLPADVASVLFIGSFVAQEYSECTETVGTAEKKTRAGQGKTKGKTARGRGVRCTVSAAVCLLVIQFGMQVYTKTVHAFWEEPVWNLDTKITEGPLKGTVTTKEKAEDYGEKLEDIKVHLKKDGPVLFAGKDTWCYLYADAEYGTFSSYLSGSMEQAAERWQVYYEVHPEKIPYYIYIPKENSEEWTGRLQQDAPDCGYRIEESETAYHLYKL